MPPASADPERPGVSPAAPISAVIVLAAGAGTRMKSDRPKVLHELAGKPMLWHALRSAAGLAPQQLVAVLGHGRDRVGQFLADSADLPPVVTAVQDQQKGTGHACACAIEVTGELTGTVLVTYGDVPLLRTETLSALAAEHTSSGNAVTVLTAEVSDPTGYGRILRGDSGELVGIVEQKDADDVAAQHPRGELRGVRLRRRSPRRRTRPVVRRQRRRRALPDRCRRHRPLRRPQGRFRDRRRRRRDRGHQRPGAARRARQGAQRTARAQGATGRRHRARSRHHLDPRGRHHRTGHRDPAWHPAAGRHHHRQGAARSARTPR